MAEIVEGVLAEATTFSGKRILLFLVGNRENVGQELLDQGVVSAMEDGLRDALISSSPEVLAGESDPVGLVELMVETTAGREAVVRMAEDDGLTLALLTDSMGEAHAQGLGAAAVEVTDILAWDRLVEYLGNDLLIRRTAELFDAAVGARIELSAQQRKALDLAADYAAGTRPETPIERLMRIQKAAQTRVAEAPDDPFPGQEE